MERESVFAKRRDGTVVDGNDKPIEYGDFAVTRYGERDGLCGINCRHKFGAFIPELSQVPDYEAMGYPTDPKEIERKYNETQKQRRLEREIRAAKREIAALEETGEDIGIQAVKLRTKQNELKAYLESTGLARQSTREQVAGFDRAAMGRATKAANLELDKKQNISYNRGMINTGGKKMDEKFSSEISGALNPNSREAQKHADVYYESVRKMTTDIDNISKNTGYTNEYISKVKEHLFMQKHDLGGENLEYFYADYEIGQSWQRLIDGKNIQTHDYILLQHEYAEQNYMSKGYSQQQAHDMANKEFNYKKSLSEG